MAETPPPLRMAADARPTRRSTCIRTIIVDEQKGPHQLAWSATAGGRCHNVRNAALQKALSLFTSPAASALFHATIYATCGPRALRTCNNTKNAIHNKCAALSRAPPQFTAVNATSVRCADFLTFAGRYSEYTRSCAAHFSAISVPLMTQTERSQSSDLPCGTLSPTYPFYYQQTPF